MAYEFAMLLADIKHANPIVLSSENVLEALSKVHDHPGRASGRFSFRNSLDVGKFFEFELQVKRIAGEQFVKMAD